MALRGISLATPCTGCSHPLNLHSHVGHPDEVCLACASCTGYVPDSCYSGHAKGCEHMKDTSRPMQCRAEHPDRPLPPVSGYQTKDSGSRAEYDSGMVRDTQEGKARFELLLPLGVPYEAQFMVRVAELMARGAEKYTSRNWEKATGDEEMERFKSSALRHLMQWAAGEDDEDHAAAVVFNLLGYETTKWRRRGA